MAECSSEELARALTDRSNFSCSSRGEAIGITTVAEAGLLSLLGILFVVLIIVRNVRWRMRHLTTAPLRVFHQPMDILMASLLIADMVQAIGAIMILKWAHAGKVEVGTFCTAQGIIRIIGATTVAFSTSAIGIYTFLGVWAMKDIKSMRVTLGVVVTFWSFILVLVTIALTLNRNQNFNFMAPTPYWCWVNVYDVGPAWKIALEYMWIWLRLFLTFPIYTTLFLWIRGNLIDDENTWWRIRFKFQTVANPNPETLARNRKALVMLAYPLVDCICLLPMSVVRWNSFLQGQNTVPPAVDFAAQSLFALNGFFNAILLLKTRPTSGLFGKLMFRTPARPPSPSEQHDSDDMEMTGDSGLRTQKTSA